MKKIMVFTLLLFSKLLFAQNEEAEDTTAHLAITEAGKPDGRLAEQMITKDGGTLLSADGSLELIIPPNALSKKTRISIQPVTNTMPNGNGQSYRLEPSGIQFRQPVRLIFHYTEEESPDEMQLLMGIGMHDNTGQWYSLKNFSLDTIAKTISGAVNHFSEWSRFDRIKLYPEAARLKVKKSLKLFINLVSEQESSDDLMQLVSIRRRRAPWNATWMANEIVDGNATEGRIVSTSSYAINYTAAVNVPPKNPVAVTADLTGIVYRTIVNGQAMTFERLRLVSNVLIYDVAYEVKMISTLDASAGSVLGKVVYKDEGSFVVSLESGRAKIIERVNRNIPDKLEYYGKCDIRTTKPGSGNIHIIGIAVPIVVTPVTATKGAIIEMHFRPYPVVLPVLNCDCPPIGKGDRYRLNTADVVEWYKRLSTAFPKTVIFEAKEEEQELPGTINEGGTMYKVTVKQVKED